MKYAPVEFSSENIDALYRVSKCSNLNKKMRRTQRRLGIIFRIMQLKIPRTPMRKPHWMSGGSEFVL